MAESFPDLFPPELLKKVNMLRYEVGTVHLVEVTHINDPKSFYVRPKCFRDDVKPLEERGWPISITDATIGKRVVYKSSMLGKFVRGAIEVILFRDDSIVCNIFALDYGCREREVSQKYIFLPKYNIPCPPLAVHCKLYLCEPKNGKFNNEAIDAMRFFVGTEFATIKVMIKTMPELTVELRTVECPDDVATTLGLLHFTTLTAGAQEINNFTQSGPRIIKYKENRKHLEVGQKLQVQLQSWDSVSSFYVVDVKDYEERLKFSYRFVQYCMRQIMMADVPVAVADGRACGVRVSGPTMYERAVVKRITVPNSKALVKLVDWGKEVEANFCEIKDVKSPVFVELPAQAIYCSSTEDQIFDNSLPDCSASIIIEIKELGNGIDVPHKVNMSPVPSAD